MQDMNAIALLRELRTQGMPEGQAEIIANALTTNASGQAATKRDVETALAATKRDIDTALVATKREVRADLDATKTDMLAAFAAHKHETNERFDAIDQKFDTIDKRFDAVDKRFDAVDRRFDAIDAQFEQMNAKLDLNLARTELSNKSLMDRILRAMLFGAIGAVGLLLAALNMILSGRIRVG